MLLHEQHVPGLAISSYLIADESTGEAAVIDPTRDVGALLAFAREHALRIKHVMETHVHADFVSGAREIKARLAGSPVIHCSGLGGKEWTPPYADHVVSDGDDVRLGSLRLRATHTPGHTPEHVSWLLFDESRSRDEPWVMFTGDFLFVGDVGRPDLLGEQEKQQLAGQLYHSVFDILAQIPDFTEVFPSHGAGSLCGKALSSRRSSTVGFERRFNPALVRRPRARWVADLMAEMPLAPPYFRRMKHVNREGPAIVGPELPGQRRWGAREVYERVCDQCLILDARSKEAFAAAHIPGAISIPFGPSLATWAGWVLPYDCPILVVGEHPSQMPEVAKHLIRVGFDDVVGWLEGGIDAWETGGFAIAAMGTMSVQQLHGRLGDGREGLTILDVRTEREWGGGHIAGAKHIHGGTLQDRCAEVPHGPPVAVVCGSGYRASIAASFLKRQGHVDVFNVIGGMSAWRSAGFPVEADR